MKEITPSLLQYSREQIQGALASKQQIEFMKFNWLRKDEPFVPGPHTEAICARIDRAIEQYRNGETVYLKIKVPFRHGKSEIVARHLPPRFLGEFPDAEIIVASYASGLAETFSRDARRIIENENYAYTYPDVRLDPKRGASNSWGIEYWNDEKEAWKASMGSTHYVGLEGGITGKGGKLIILDDPFSGRQEAESETTRNSRWEAVKNDLLTRRAPRCVVIFLATPWHVDDIFGRIEREMEKNPEFPRFEDLTFPAWTEDGGKRKYLHLERYSEKWYKEQEATLGTYGTASLLLCKPTVKEGNLLKIEGVQYVDKCPEDITYTIGWDLASSKKQRIKDDPDYTVGIKLGIRWQKSGMVVDGKEQYRPVLYVDDMVRGRWEGPARNSMIVETCLRMGHLTVGVESFGAYKDAYTALSQTLRGIRVVKKLQLPGDKVSKASVLEAPFEDGSVFLRRADWNQAFLDEVGEFPGGLHDDVVDAMVVAYHCHNPYATSIWGTGTGSRVMKEFEIDFDRLSESSTLVCSEWMERDMTTGVVLGLWNSKVGALFIFGEKLYHSPQPVVVLVDLCKYLREISNRQLMNMTKFTWFANKMFFGGKLVADDISMAYLRYNCYLQENEAYEEYGAIQSTSRLFARKKVWVHPRCEETLRQIGEWAIEDTKPANGNVMARAVSLLAASIYETGLDAPPEPGFAPYSEAKTRFQKEVAQLAEAGQLDKMTDDEVRELYDGKKDARFGWM